jgi:enoyl-[acyl-carrier-protein] reductase (NADH)
MSEVAIRDADTATFLASDRAAAITGSVVDVSCGSAMRTAAVRPGARGVLD